MNCPSCGDYLVEGFCKPCAQASAEEYERCFGPGDAEPEDIRSVYARLQAEQPEAKIDELRFVTRGPIRLGTCVETDPIDGVALTGIVTACVQGHTGYRIKALAWKSRRQVRRG